VSSRLLPPEPGRVLYASLFGGRDRAVTLQRLSDGLPAVIDNAGFLLADARLLADSQRYARAGFLIATSQEEIAKAYILLDACRLDFPTQEGPLRLLCKAFYDHVPKYAYYHTLRFNSDMPRRPCLDLDRIRELFQNDLKRWWPSTDPESGEPDMPHDTYFTRESNLYADFSDWSEEWVCPQPDNRGFAFDQTLGMDTLANTYTMLDRLKLSRDNGLLAPPALAVLNDVFGKSYINHQTTSEELWRLYDKLAQRIEAEPGIVQATVLTSSLVVWPLYHFLQR
jgi:AbiV family abortive infection protein